MEKVFLITENNSHSLKELFKLQLQSTQKFTESFTNPYCLLETLRDRGWQVLAGIDIGPKRSFEKFILLMSKCESARLKFACVAPGDMDR